MSEKAEKSEQKVQAEQMTAAAPNRQTPEHARGAEAVLALQRAAGNRAVANLIGGRPLDAATLKEAEARFGEKFDDVRVHTGEEAARSAEALGAKAWTEGRDIVFGGGKYSPSTNSGKKVLAHELAHVVQQRRGGIPPSTFDRSGATELDAASAASQYVTGQGTVSVKSASATGVARDEADEPWWKQRLNPLYQKALQVLPPQGAAALEQANEYAKGVVDKYGVSDQRINQVVQNAEPVIQPVADFLGVKSEVPPPKTDEQKEDQSKDVTWLGTPPIEVQLQQRREQQKAQAALDQDNPGALAPPMKKKTSAVLPDIFMGPDPEPTDFEAQLKAGKPFTQQIHPRPDFDPRDGVWLGHKPSDDELKGMRFEDPNHPSRKIWVDDGKAIDFSINPDAVMPIRDPKTHELTGYRVRQGETLTDLDRNGEIINSRGLEAPLEHPAIDPIDVGMLAFDLGPMVAKGVTASGKALLEWAAKSGTRELGELGGEEGVSTLGRELPKIDLGGAPANDVTPFENPSVNAASEADLEQNVVDLDSYRTGRIENSDERATRLAAGQDFSADPTVASGGRSGRPIPLRRSAGGPAIRTPPPINPVMIGRRQGPWLDLQSMFSGSKVKYIGNKAFIQEQELDGVLFDRIEKNVLGEVKGDYSVPMRLGSQDAADRLVAEAWRQMKISRKYGMALEWHVRKADLAGFQNVVGAKFPKIKFVPY
jgi:Domain of unknown function (DUF4157)